MPKRGELLYRHETGERFGRLVVVCHDGGGKWRVRCDCGTEKAVHGHALRSGVTVSCGCFSRDLLVAKGEITQATLDRFWSFVSKAEGCWEWNGARHVTRGYGRFSAGGKTNIASRWIYEQTHGPVGVGMEVCHRCDNPACVRPDHLFAGTKSDNMRDAANKGRLWLQSSPELALVARLTWDQVNEMRRMFNEGASTREIANRFGVGQRHARMVVTNRKWRVAA